MIFASNFPGILLPFSNAGIVTSDFANKTFIPAIALSFATSDGMSCKLISVDVQCIADTSFTARQLLVKNK